ncbi:MAG: hypothetical protein AAFX50_12190, partial [Acidobacteriota bacterium]
LPTKLLSFLGSLAIAWQTIDTRHEFEDRADAFRAFVLVSYLRAYHPQVFRLLSHDPHLVKEFRNAITEDMESPGPRAPAVRRFFYQSFRHVAESTPVEDAQAVVGELVERIDRYRGDRAFVEMWWQNMPADEVRLEMLCAPGLRVVSGDV